MSKKKKKDKLFLKDSSLLQESPSMESLECRLETLENDIMELQSLLFRSFKQMSEELNT